MSYLDATNNGTDWVDDIVSTLLNNDEWEPSDRGIFLAQVSRHFDQMVPREKNTAFLYLLGKIVRQSKENESA